MGSGETAPTMMPIHRRVLADAGSGPAVILDTPFGFQTNADDLVEKTSTYFRDSVGREVQVASWRRRDASTIQQEKALALLASASWAFAGPGSPSYALRQWTDTAIPAALAAVVERGGTVCLGSAAAVLAGQFALPVYEIYKGGADAYWLDGLDLLGTLTGLEAAVIPHYDNNEGGHYDTRFCYMGEQRLEVLEEQLPEHTGILGIDEHTGVLIDIEAATVEVVGNGSMTVRAHGVSQRFGAGTTMSLAELSERLRGERGSGSAVLGVAVAADVAAPDDVVVASLRTIADAARADFDAALQERHVDSAIAAVLDLEQAMRDWSADMQQGDPEYARRVLRAMIVHLGEVAQVGARDPHEVLDPFVSALLEIRAAARVNKDFATSDLVRDKLAEAGVEVRDTGDGVTWQLRA
jgi:cyanophycinase-like exopeptidase